MLSQAVLHLLQDICISSHPVLHTEPTKMDRTKPAILKCCMTRREIATCTQKVLSWRNKFSYDQFRQTELNQSWPDHSPPTYLPTCHSSFLSSFLCSSSSASASSLIISITIWSWLVGNYSHVQEQQNKKTPLGSFSQLERTCHSLFKKQTNKKGQWYTQNRYQAFCRHQCRCYANSRWALFGSLISVLITFADF